MKRTLLPAALALALTGCLDTFAFDQVRAEHIAEAEVLCRANGGVVEVSGRVAYDTDTDVITGATVWVECANGAVFGNRRVPALVGKPL
jgi:hypothetical protein